MTKATNGNEMQELRLLKINAYKAVDEALKRNKSVELISVSEMEGIKDKVKPILDCVGKHIEIMKKEEGTMTKKSTLGRCMSNLSMRVRPGKGIQIKKKYFEKNLIIIIKILKIKNVYFVRARTI